MRLDWVNATYGNGSTPLTYLGGGHWATGCETIGGTNYSWTFDCFSDGMLIGFLIYTGACPGTHSVFSHGTVAATQVPYEVTSPLAVSDNGYSEGFRGFHVVDPDSVACCFSEWTVLGCFSNALPGALISLWTDSTKATSITTGTTVSDGTCLVDTGSFQSGTFYYEVTKSRFILSSGAVFITCDMTGISVTLTIATGYHCLTSGSSCGDPEPDTLHMNHPVFGAMVFTYVSGNWTCTVVYAYPGIMGTCPASTVTITATITASSGAYKESWHSSGACPDDAGATVNTVTWSFPTGTCAPGFSQTYTLTPSAGAQQNLYQTSSLLTVVFTE